MRCAVFIYFCVDECQNSSTVKPPGFWNRIIFLRNIYRNRFNQTHDAIIEMKENETLNAWPVDEEENGSASPMLQFEDNFKPFLKMHDSYAYIANLENRLSNLKGADKRRLDGKEMLEALFRAKDDHMIRHVHEGNGSCLADEEDDDKHTVRHNALLDKMYPERQALSAEELVHLLSSDKLNLTVKDQENNKQNE